MKQKIFITLAIVALVMTILAGCSRAAPKSPSPVPVNPAPATTASSSPVTPLPPSPTATNNDGTSSPMLQSGVPLSVSEPADAATLTASAVTVKGQTKPGTTVNVNDQIVTADSQGNFSVPISLDDGLNAIDVIATDGSGNQGEVLLMVSVDLSQAASPTATGNSSPVSTDASAGTPPLKITSPVDGADINGDQVTVTGQTAPDASVSINDQADFADDQGNFSIPVSLSAGANSLDVVVIDDNGNQNEVILMVNDTSGT